MSEKLIVKSQSRYLDIRNTVEKRLEDLKNGQFDEASELSPQQKRLLPVRSFHIIEENRRISALYLAIDVAALYNFYSYRREKGDTPELINQVKEYTACKQPVKISDFNDLFIPKGGYIEVGTSVFENGEIGYCPIIAFPDRDDLENVFIVQSTFKKEKLFNYITSYPNIAFYYKRYCGVILKRFLLNLI